jgi:hypothetical protein
MASTSTPMSEAQLERLHTGLARIAALPPEELQILVESLLAEPKDELDCAGRRVHAVNRSRP